MSREAIEELKARVERLKRELAEANETIEISYVNGYKSRDDEVRELRQILESIGSWNEIQRLNGSPFRIPESLCETMKNVLEASHEES